MAVTNAKRRLPLSVQGLLARIFGLQGPALYYFVFVVVCGMAVLWLNFFHLKASYLAIYVIWTILNFLSELKPLPFFGTNITVSSAVQIAAYILFDIPTAILTGAGGSLLADLTGRRGFNKALFNVCQYAISIYFSGLVFYLLKPSQGVIFDLRQDFWVLILGYLTYTVLNASLVLTIVSLTTGKKLSSTFRRGLQLELMHSPTMLPLALLVVYLYQEEPVAIVFLAVPLIMAHVSLRNYTELHSQTRGTLEVLADIIDRRDPYTASHSQRVAKLAEATAGAMGLRPEEVEQIAMAGRVHDIGKIAISDSILLKNGRLTPEEYEIIKTHPRHGYHLLHRLGLYRKCAHYVLHHHEHFDGSGYPDGLKGNAIPLGARILSVADAFDAMTTDRPYRKALTNEQALQELKRSTGTQFDPLVVDAFCKMLEKNTVQPREGGHCTF